MHVLAVSILTVTLQITSNKHRSDHSHPSVLYMYDWFFNSYVTPQMKKLSLTLTSGWLPPFSTLSAIGTILSACFCSCKVGSYSFFIKVYSVRNVLSNLRGQRRVSRVLQSSKLTQTFSLKQPTEWYFHFRNYSIGHYIVDLLSMLKLLNTTYTYPESSSFITK